MMDAALSAVATVGAMGLLLVGWLFARSLRPGATPLVLRFAQAEDPVTVQQPLAQRYLRWLTLLWAAALLVAAYLVGRRVAGAPVVPGMAGVFAPAGLAVLLFFGERTVRRVVFGAASVGPVAQQWRVATRILREEAATYLPLPFSGRPESIVRLPDIQRDILVWRDRHCSVGQLEAAAWHLAARLPCGQRVLVVCEDRAVFLWAVLAAWAARRTVVLPPADLKPPPDDTRRNDFDCVVTDRPGVVPTGTVPVLAVDADDLRAALAAAVSDGPPIALPPAHPAAVFFTSGSTGQPEAHRKSWRQLICGADAMEELLQLKGKAPLLGGTVIHSHKFGFETLVMQAIRGAAAVWAHRIVFPADLEEFCGQPAPLRWLITTPYHLELFAAGGPLAPGLDRIVSATMPLEPSLAARLEAATGAEVHEIYGSTEAGCIATRRTAKGLEWRLANDFRLVVDADGAAILLGQRAGGLLKLRDCVVKTEGGFELLGRDSDLVKIAGKRTSLQALTATLRAIDGVEDGAFIDGTAIGQRRLAAVAVAPQLSSEEIRALLARRIDAAFLPRPLVRVDELPRDANGKLRLGALAGLIAAAQRRGSRDLTEALHSHAG